MATDVVSLVLVRYFQLNESVDVVLSALSGKGVSLGVKTARRWLDVFRGHARQYSSRVVSEIRRLGGKWSVLDLRSQARVSGLGGSKEKGRMEGYLFLRALEEVYELKHGGEAAARTERMGEFWNYYLWKKFGVHLCANPPPSR